MALGHIGLCGVTMPKKIPTIDTKNIPTYIKIYRIRENFERKFIELGKMFKGHL